MKESIKIWQLTYNKIWQDKGIQATYTHRSQYQLIDAAKYLIERIGMIVEDGYLPSDQDIFQCRAATTGIVENTFDIKGHKLRIVDVGGQRSERKKWIHCFEGVNAVLYVAALSEYDQLLYEDEKTNRMEETLVLWNDIVNSRWFKKTHMILFLNKIDLFTEKINTVPITVAFPDYQGDNSLQSTTEYIRKKFESYNRRVNKRIYTHLTCATDSTNITKVFSAIKDIITRQALNDAGLDY